MDTLLARKWSRPTLKAISAGLGFAQIKQRLGITSKTLTTELRLLQHKGLVVKESDGYRITRVGREFLDVLRPFERLSKRYSIRRDTRSILGDTKAS